MKKARKATTGKYHQKRLQRIDANRLLATSIRNALLSGIRRLTFLESLRTREARQKYPELKVYLDDLLELEQRHRKFFGLGVHPEAAHVVGPLADVYKQFNKAKSSLTVEQLADYRKRLLAVREEHCDQIRPEEFIEKTMLSLKQMHDIGNPKACGKEAAARLFAGLGRAAFNTLESDFERAAAERFELPTHMVLKYVDELVDLCRHRHLTWSEIAKHARKQARQEIFSPSKEFKKKLARQSRRTSLPASAKK